MFFGREQELETLRRLFEKRTASFVVCKGRRRIGKSTLIQKFAESADVFLEFQGLVPEKKIGKHDQLDNFCGQLAKQTRFPKVTITDWDQAFSLLNSAITGKKTVILLDEISWMADGSPAFHAQLKAAWDMELKKHAHLVLVVCGSASLWIEKNIIHNTGFVGRLSLEITLQELSLPECNRFWRNKPVSYYDKLRLLSVTGGVPRYLEEIDPSISAEENIHNLCFRKEGFLFSEFEKIFNDIFDRRAEIYRRILNGLIDGRKNLGELCAAIGIEKGGKISEYLSDLIESGFVSADYIYNPESGKRTNQIRYRVKDNYVRFYLKYIEPLSEKVQQDIYTSTSIDNFLAWESVLGLQFENLVMNNLPLMIHKLRINPASIVAASPYFQKKTNKNRGTQIDLLIQTRNSLYPCEVKFRKNITVSVISEVKAKVSALHIPKALSVRPVLIYAGELDPAIPDEDYFDKIVPFQNLLLPDEK